MPPVTKKPAATKKKPNRVEVMQAVDKMPTRQAGGQPGMQPGQGGAPGMAPPPAFPFSANQLDGAPAGVPHLPGMFLRSFAPPSLGMAPGQGMTPPPQPGGQAPPMAAQGQGPKPARSMQRAPGAR